MLIYLSWRRTASTWVIEILKKYCKENNLKYNDAVFYPTSNNIEYLGFSFGTHYRIHNPKQLINNDIIQIDRQNEFFINQLKNENINFNAFTIIRDPRDILISDYFFIKNGKSKNFWILRIRPILKNLDMESGINFLISYYISRFDEMERIIDNNEIMKISYDQITNNPSLYFKKIFTYGNISINEILLNEIINKNNFDFFSNGRQKGIENQNSHYRIGISGSWKKYFNNKNILLFNILYSSLINKIQNIK